MAGCFYQNPISTSELYVLNNMNALADKTLKVGDSAPDFILPDTHGNAVRLYSLLRVGHVVIVFYRGNWCPYCDLQLRDFQRRLADLRALRAQVVAISPHLPANLLWSQAKNHLEFPVLSDVGDKVARQFGLLLQLSTACVNCIMAYSVINLKMPMVQVANCPFQARFS